MAMELGSINTINSGYSSLIKSKIIRAILRSILLDSLSHY